MLKNKFHSPATWEGELFLVVSSCECWGNDRRLSILKPNRLCGGELLVLWALEE